MVLMLGVGWLGYLFLVWLRKLGYQLKIVIILVEKVQCFNDKGFEVYQIEVIFDGINGRIDDFLQVDILVFILLFGGCCNLVV